MKGFPNQISNISKIASALNVLSNMLCEGTSTDDDSFGEALLFNGVTKPGRHENDIDSYLDQVRRLSPSNQSHRTTARGIKELLRHLRLVFETGGRLSLTDAGRALLYSWEVID